MSKSKARTVKTTLEIPLGLWKAAGHKAVDEQVALRVIVIRALERYLGVKAEE